MPPTPIKDTIKPTNVDPPIISFNHKSRISPFNSISSYRSFGGSKDEAFFDTQGWLDSDCDDDFHSVNGDFTPSRSNTPVAGTPRLSRVFSPQVSRAIFEGKPHIRSASNQSRGSPSVRRSFSSIPQATESFSEDLDGLNSASSSTTTSTSTSTTKSKKLLDLFKESMRERGDVGLTSPFSDLPRTSTSRAPSGLRYVSSSDNAIPADERVPVKEKSGKFSHHCFPRMAYVRSFSTSKKRSNNPPMSTDDLKA
ncbi:hypothetical protein SOVF_057680 [Spinacia oleracea]|nr:hypothetical protein SOVF_057680 [Spinacia oleracea]